jgi:hypothetical protein
MSRESHVGLFLTTLREREGDEPELHMTTDANSKPAIRGPRKKKVRFEDLDIRTPFPS